MKKQGERLKLIRISKGMSQDNVAKALGITIGAYSKIERGGTRLNLDRLDQLAGIFNIDLNNLIGYLNGESDAIDQKVQLPGIGFSGSPNNQEVLLLKKIVQLYDESRDMNIKAALKNQLESNKVNIPSFLDVLKGVNSNLSQKKLDAGQISNFNKGIEMLETLLT